MADISEQELVRRIFADTHWRYRLGVPPRVDPLAPYRLETRLPKALGVEGEVDILLCPHNDPSHAVVVEVKKVKVSGKSFITGTPNGLPGLRKGIAQANKLWNLGFSRVYLYIYTAVDSRDHNRGSVSYAGATPELIAKIRANTPMQLLQEEVGKVEFELVQPMNRPPFETGAFGSSLVRLAVAQRQPSALTEWVAAQFSTHAA